MTTWVYWKQDLILIDGRVGNNTISGYGTFVVGLVGSLFSAAAIVLVYQTYKSQKEELNETREELKKQNESLCKQNFESTFFNLLNLKNNIVSHLKDSSSAVQYLGSTTYVQYE